MEILGLISQTAHQLHQQQASSPVAQEVALAMPLPIRGLLLTASVIQNLAAAAAALTLGQMYTLVRQGAAAVVDPAVQAAEAVTTLAHTAIFQAVEVVAARVEQLVTLTELLHPALALAALLLPVAQEVKDRRLEQQPPEEP